MTITQTQRQNPRARLAFHADNFGQALILTLRAAQAGKSRRRSQSVAKYWPARYNWPPHSRR